MGRIILGVIAGFILWSILWIGSDQLLMAVWPEWYGEHQIMFQFAMNENKPFVPDSTILIMHIIRSIIISIIAGFFAAMIAKENSRSTLALGVLLLAFGTTVQLMAWNYLPIWYHLIFLVLLVPMTILGGKLKSTT